MSRILSSTRHELQVYPPRLPSQLFGLAAFVLFVGFLWEIWS